MPIKDIKDILNMDSKSEVLLSLPRDPANHRDRKEITDPSPRSSLKYLVHPVTHKFIWVYRYLVPYPGAKLRP
jgi:hypothetical protein